MMRKLYALSIALVATLMASAQISVSVTGNSNTTPALQATYPSFSAALTDLNAVTAMTGPVTLTLAAGATEEAPAKGFTIGSATLNAALSSTNTLTITKAAGAATILTAGIGTAAPNAASPDGILKIVGADYVTIDGLTLVDGNTTNPETMEFGIGIFKASDADGAQHNMIRNCTITLNRINNASGSGPMVEGSVGINMVNSIPTAATTSLTPSGASGTNSNNSFHSNVIENCNYGIVINGYAASSPFTLGDTGNDIGGGSPATGNTITNFGGGGTSNPAAGIRVNNQWSANISNNTINNNTGTGVNHGTTLRGIYAQAGTSANITIMGNTITLKGGATTSAVTAIENGVGSTAASNSVVIVNNIIENCTYTTATSGTLSGILNSATAANVVITGNQIINNSVGNAGTNSSATFQAIYSSGASTNINLTITGNTISNNTIQNSYGTIYGIRGSTSNPFMVAGNTISNLGIPNSAGGTSSSIYGIYNASSPTNEGYFGNNINNLSINGSSTATGHVIYGIYNLTINGSTVEASGNNVNNLSFVSTGSGYATVAGIRINYGTVTMSHNVVHGLSSTGGSPTVAGIYSGSSSLNAVRIFNNLVGDVSAPAANGHNLFGIYIGTSGSQISVYNNTVVLNATSTGTNFASSALYMSSTTPTVTLRNNLLVNLSTATGTGRTAVIRRTSTSLTAYGSASNNNLLYAGTPGPSNVMYFDGTNAYETLVDFQAAVAPREGYSVTETVSATPGVYFQSLTGPATGTTTNFLHLVPALTTRAESGGDGSGLSLTNDYDGDIRAGETGYTGTGSNPDIGADEFEGTVAALTDIAVIGLVTPGTVACDNANTPVTVTIRNSGTVPIDFATTNVTVNAAVSGAVVAALSSTLNTGSLAPGATADVVLAPTLAMTTAGTYDFAITVTLAGDAEPGNNTLNASRSLDATMALPQSIDFTGFNGTNLTTLFPNWREASGATTPSGTTSGWTNSTNFPGTAKINLYFNTANEWLIGPKFLVTPNTKLKYEVAITDYNSSGVDPDGMAGTDDKVVVKMSLDCGQTWTDLYTYNSANTATITNTLTPQEIDLSTYAGQTAIIAFFGSDGTVNNDPNDYDFHIDNVRIVNELPNDVGAIALAQPGTEGCFSAAETVVVTIQNHGTAPIDLALTPITVTTNVTGAANTTLSGVANTGTLAPGATLDVTMTGTLNMSAYGTYTFDASTSMTGDAQTANDAMPTTTRTRETPATLPVAIDFTGYDGGNLPTVFPGWREGSGKTAPSGTTSSWVNRTGLGGASNVTAKVNLYDINKAEWIVGPKVTPTATTQLKFKVAITDYNSTAADPAGIAATDDSVIVRISTDCGVSWTDVMVFDAASAGSISNSFVDQTLSLGAYAGQDVIIAFYATEGLVNDVADYDFHIDDVSIENVPMCTGAVGGTAATTTNEFCESGSATITASGYSTGGASGYQWQSSTDNTNWNDIAGAINPATMTTGTLTATTYFRLKVTCPAGTATDYSNTITITVSPNPTATVTPAGPVVLCAPATQLLTAGTNATTPTYQWQVNGADINGATASTYTADGTGVYTVTVTESSTGCSSTSTGVNVEINSQPGAITITPASPAVCPGVATQLTASAAGSNLNVTWGTGANTSTGNTTTAGLGPNPLQNYYGGTKLQMLFSAAELSALGLVSGAPITSVGLHLANADNGYALQGLTIKMKNTTTAALTSSGWETGLTTVKAPASYSPVVGLNTFTLDQPFDWDGTSNLVIEFNYSNNNTGTSAGVFNRALHSPTSFVSSAMYRGDNVSQATVDGYTNNPSFTYSSRNDVTFTTGSPNITWSPVTGLFTDAAATIPYAGGPAASVYAQPAATTAYTATATSAAGCTNTATETVTIGTPPAITTQPTAQAACEGASATFSVVATGGNLTYQWRKNGVNIAGATSASYTIANVAAADADNYDVVVAGDCGSVTSNAVALTVNSAPAITTQPADETACLGGNVTFSVAATGTGLSYQWRMNGSDIAGATSASYTINGAVAGDAGNYDVVITGTCGTVTSNIAALTVEAAPTITTQPADQQTCLGGSATFSVTASGLGLTYQWRKNGVNIAGATTDTYTINNVSATDADDYDVIVTGTCGSVISNTASLTLNGTTTITTQPADQTGCVGDNVSFTVAASGSNLSYQWRKNGTDIAGETSATLTLTNITAADAADYDVVITGDCGSVTSNTASLTIGQGPAITTQPVDVTVCFDNNATFSVVATGAGLTYQWRKDGTNISGATNATYTIVNAGTSDEGDYDVVVTSACGSVTSDVVSLTVTACTSVPNVDQTISAAQLLPNVINHSAVLRVTATRIAKVNWTVTDMNGRVVMKFDQSVNVGINDLQLQLGHLAGGMYQLSGTTANGKVVTLRFTRF